MALVNQVIPHKGDTVTAKLYRQILENKGYNHFQRIGSIGGSKTQGTIKYNLKKIVRL